MAFCRTDTLLIVTRSCLCIPSWWTPNPGSCPHGVGSTCFPASFPCAFTSRCPRGALHEAGPGLQNEALNPWASAGASKRDHVLLRPYLFL